MRNDGIRADKITVIHNGIQLGRLEDVQKYALANKDIGVPTGDRIIGTIARLSPEKSQDILVNAAKIVIDRIPNTHLVFVGDGPEREKLSSIATRLGIEKNVHFLGFKQRVAPILKLFDVFVLSSTATELFSAATLEAMAMGKPVVVTDVGSMKEMVLHEVTGFIVPPFDKNMLAARILEFLENPQKAKTMGQAGKERVEKNFTADREARELEALFQKLLTKHRVEGKELVGTRG
jgi:glycosyltransferase involved in cell wall biosynthesis